MDPLGGGVARGGRPGLRRPGLRLSPGLEEPINGRCRGHRPASLASSIPTDLLPFHVRRGRSTRFHATTLRKSLGLIASFRNFMRATPMNQTSYALKGIHTHTQTHTFIHMGAKNESCIKLCRFYGVVPTMSDKRSTNRGDW